MPDIAQRVENALELAQELVALLGAAARGGRQRLAAQLRRLEPEQLPAQRRRVATQHPQPLADVAREPLRPCQPPAPVKPAGQDRDQQPGEDAQPDQSREQSDQRR